MQMKIFKRMHVNNGMKTKEKWRKWPLFYPFSGTVYHHKWSSKLITMNTALCVLGCIWLFKCYFSHKLRRKCFSICASARGKRESTGTGEGRPAVKIACFYHTETEMTFSRWHQKLSASVYFKLGPPSMRQEHAGAQRGTDKGDKGMQGW